MPPRCDPGGRENEATYRALDSEARRCLSAWGAGTPREPEAGSAEIMRRAVSAA